MLKNLINPKNIHLFLLSLYLGGIISIGTWTLIPQLEDNPASSLIFGLEAVVSYIVIVYLLHKFELEKNPFYFNAIPSVSLPSILIVSLFMRGAKMGPKFFFYLLMYLLVAFLVSFLYSRRYYGVSTKIDALKLEFEIYKEMLIGFFFTTIAIGGSYVLIRGADPIRTREMILIIWTYSGIIIFGMGPVLALLLEIVKEVENMPKE